jgi:hypothetical protein
MSFLVQYLARGRHIESLLSSQPDAVAAEAKERATLIQELRRDGVISRATARLLAQHHDFYRPLALNPGLLEPGDIPKMLQSERPLLQKLLKIRQQNPVDAPSASALVLRTQNPVEHHHARLLSSRRMNPIDVLPSGETKAQAFARFARYRARAHIPLHHLDS